MNIINKAAEIATNAISNKDKKVRKLTDKLKSTKMLITIWACGLITFIVLSGKEAFIPIASLLTGCPLAYFVVNGVQHYINDKQQLGDSEK